MGDPKSLLKKRFIIVYAAELGRSELVANEIYKSSLLGNEFAAEKYPIDEFHEKFKLNEINVPIVFICSTTGNGQVPLRAREFLTFIQSFKDPAYLNNLNYAILGFGNSRFPRFCGGSKKLHLKLQELGANCFYGPLYSDDEDSNLLEGIFKKEILNKIREFHMKDPTFCSIM